MMAVRGVALTLTYTAWDSSANAPKTGDVANHTIRLIRDGTEATPTNAPAEVDATNAKGEYRLTLTAGEMAVDFITVCGVSSTANVNIIPVKITTEHGVLPTVQQGNAGAVVTSGTSTGQIDVSGGKVGVASDGMDAVAVEAGLNLRQAIAIIASACAGVLAGAATTSITIAAAGVPGTNRVTATCDSSGNRTAVSLSPPA